MTEDDILDHIRPVAAILHLGNIKFASASMSSLSSQATLDAQSEKHLQKACHCLDIPKVSTLKQVLLLKAHVINGKVDSTSPLSTRQAEAQLNGLMRMIYLDNFDALLKRLNTGMKGSGHAL
jgi:myosin heavy subunit